MKPAPYGPFPYSAINRRPKFVLPADARVALWVIINIEFFPLNRAMPGDANERPKGNDGTPMVRQWAQRDYGNRVGVFRIMEALSKRGIRGTVALNSDVCDHHPEIIDDCLKLGWETMGHNRTNVDRLNDVPPESERDLIKSALDRIETATGRRPVGWLGSGLQETWHTLDHLADEGCIYIADWVNDDQPYLIDAGGHKLVSVPYSYEVNDTAAIVRSRYTPGEFERIIRDQFDVLWQEGENSGRVMAICLHPYVIGQPHRIGALERALDHILGFDNVWKATGEEIARHFLAEHQSV